MKSLKKHLYWCALSTRQGFGPLIVAKWKSHLRHISGYHDGHPDPLFKKCAHGELDKERKWIKVGRAAVLCHGNCNLSFPDKYQKPQLGRMILIY